MMKLYRRIYNAIKRRVKKIIPNPNNIIRRSNWYHNQFLHLKEFERLQQGADVLCFGSTPAKFAIDFSKRSEVKGYNLAILPETIHYDFQVLKNYHSFLKDGGTALFVLCPFTFLKDKYRPSDNSDVYKDIRYYPILHRAMIDNFDIKLYKKWVDNPMSLGLQAWKRLIKDSAKSSYGRDKANKLTDSQMKESAQTRIDEWMKEFSLDRLDSESLSSTLKDSIASNVEIFKQIKSFSQERGYNTQIVIPPFSEELTNFLPADFVETTLMNPLREIGIPVLNYFRDNRWYDKTYYLDAFRMNATGRELLTTDIINKLFK